MNSVATSLRAVNLNLIPVLRALLREASVTRAAAALGLSQSATSTCLSQLRLTLDDPLLVKVGRTMQLTPRAKALQGPLEQLCGGLEDFLNPAAFDPMPSQRTFVIAAPDYMPLLLGSDLTKVLAQTAPRVSVHFVDVPPDLQSRLDSGDVDIAILAVNQLSWSSYSSGPAVLDSLVFVVARHHPLASRSVVTADELDPYLRVLWHPGLGRGVRLSSGAPVSSGLSAQLRTQTFTILPLLALESDTVTLVPRSLAERMAARLPLTILNAPFMTSTVSMSVIWSPVQEAEAGHRWFRELANSALQRLA